MKRALGLAVLWTALLLTLLIFVGAQLTPCPELAPVGIDGADRTAIMRMCQERSRANADFVHANEPWSWVAIWVAGIGVVWVVTGLVGWRMSPMREPA